MKSFLNFQSKDTTSRSEKVFTKNILRETSILLSEGKIIDAVALLKSINKRFPDHTSHWKQLANMHALAGEFQDALPYFQRLANKSPRDVTFKLRIADCLTGLKRHDEAIEVLQELYPYADGKQKYVADRLMHHKNLIEKAEAEITARVVECDRTFKDAAIKLNDEQKRVLSDIQANGIAFTSIDSLFGNTKTWEDGLKEYKNFEDHAPVQELISDVKLCQNFDKDPKFAGKHVPSKITYDAFFGSLDSEKAVSKILMNDKILEIAWSYYETACKLRNPLMWINPSINTNNISGRKGSQLWHRDQEDSSILKCFVYYSNIDEQTGATEYLPKSCAHFNNNQFSVHPFPFSSGYPNQKFFQDKIMDGSSTIANGKAGTIVFLDTNGFHRGGFVQKGQRHISMCTFIRPHSPVFNKGKSIRIVDEKTVSELQLYSCT